MLPYLDSGHKIPTYGVLIIVAIAVCMVLLIFLNTHTLIKLEDRIYGASFALVGGILGAKLLSIAISIPIIIEYKIGLEDIIKNGFVFYGGLIGGAGGILI